MDKKYEGKDLEAMSFAVNYHRWILKDFKPYVKGCVAEVGAGTGNFTKELLTCSSLEKIYCFEPSLDMFNRHKESINDSKVVAINGFFGNELPVCGWGGVHLIR